MARRGIEGTEIKCDIANCTSCELIAHDHTMRPYLALGDLWHIIEEKGWHVEPATGITLCPRHAPSFVTREFPSATGEVRRVKIEPDYITREALDSLEASAHPTVVVREFPFVGDYLNGRARGDVYHMQGTFIFDVKENLTAQVILETENGCVLKAEDTLLVFQYDPDEKDPAQKVTAANWISFTPTNQQVCIQLLERLSEPKESRCDREDIAHFETPMSDNLIYSNVGELRW